MTKGGEIAKPGFDTFESIKHTDEKGDYWYARELMKVLGYSQWRNFLQVIEKSQKSAKNSQTTPEIHFALKGKVIRVGHNNSTSIEIEDYRLDRYACYLIAQNGDPSRKPKVAGKTLANELTSANIKYNGVSGAENIKEANNFNNQTVRNAIHDSQGINPEDFPAEEDTEKIERRLTRQSKSQTLLK